MTEPTSVNNVVQEQGRGMGDGGEASEDWCAAAQKRVKEGSDGLWVRLGPRVGPTDEPQTWKAMWFGIRFNPCVSCGAVLLLFGLTIFCVAYQPAENCWRRDDDGVLWKEKCYVPKIEFQHWQGWVTDVWTWFYIGTQDVWIIFLAWICYKYGHMKLGKQDEEPEFSSFSWFSMIFSCGVGTGLFYYGVSEPLWHYTGNNRWSQIEDANKRAQEAMNTTFYHWGLHGWVCYAIVGILLAFLHFRKGLPMTIKSCFYPLVGERIYGFWGDFVDTISVVATTMGVCTSLGLGVMQVNAGFERMNGNQHWIGEGFYNEVNYDKWSGKLSTLKAIWDGYDQTFKDANPWTLGGSPNYAVQGGVADIVAENNQQLLLIWIITGFATMSVMLGLHRGIKTIASICLGLGMFLMLFMWMMDDTWYMLNLYVQSLGFYVQWIWQIGTHTGAFEQSEHGVGGYSGWVGGWTLFYWGWWIAWAPFVGVFFARISKGRTIREFCLGTIGVPVLYNFAWFAVFGGAGLKMQMLAEKYGIGCDLNVEEEGFLQSPYSRNICRVVDTDRYTTEQTLFCSTVANLSCVPFDHMLFEVLNQYGDMGPFLSGLTMISLVLYFITSSDSGSFVDDIMTSNGCPEPPLTQRFFWAMTEGLAATALLYTGRFLSSSGGALSALQAASICVGLPYTFIICFMCLALWRGLQYECGEREWGVGFKNSIIDVGITTYTCGEGVEKSMNWCRGKVDFSRLGRVLACIFFPPYAMLPTLEKVDKLRGERRSKWPLIQTVFACILFYGWLILCFVDYVPISDTPVEFGSIKGNETYDTRYWTSTRYGYYHEWASNVKDDNTTIDTSGLTNYSAQAGEGPYTTTDGTIRPATLVGDRIGRNLRIEAIGWFFYFTFCVVVTYMRFDVRTLCGIPGNIVEDWFSATFLYPTVLVQIKDHIDGVSETDILKKPIQEEGDQN